MNAESIKDQLILFAREIGFDSCRVAACEPPEHANEFRQWLDDHAYGEMHYMQRGEEKRCDPQKVLPGAKSIVVVALNYFQGVAQAGVSPATNQNAAGTAATAAGSRAMRGVTIITR